MIFAGWCGYAPGILVVLLVVFGVPSVFQPDFKLANVNPGGLSVLALISLMISRAAETRRHAEAKLTGMNEELERRVRAQTAVLEQQVAELRRANSDLEQFAYSPSHDLQEPLRNISLYTQLLQNKYSGRLDPTAGEYMSQTVAAAARMQSLLAGLRAYILISDSPHANRPHSDANEAFRSSLEDLSTVIAETGAQVTCDAPLPAVAIEPVYLKQLLQNIIGNSLKYKGADPPVIRISAAREPGEWKFCVRDNGIGVDPQYAQQVFGVFKRLHTQQEHEGSGIGLAIRKKIVERHGGRIWLESQLGQGAAFYFTISDLPA